MYAILEFGGKQYKVEEGQTLYTEKVNGVEPGSSFVFDKVLFVKKDDSVKVGSPYVQGAKINAEVIEHGKDEKMLVVKFRRRKMYRRVNGHRQQFTALKITKIEA